MIIESLPAELGALDRGKFVLDDHNGARIRSEVQLASHVQSRPFAVRLAIRMSRGGLGTPESSLRRVAGRRPSSSMDKTSSFTTESTRRGQHRFGVGTRRSFDQVGAVVLPRPIG